MNIIHIKIYSIKLRNLQKENQPLSLVSKQMRKHDCIISQTDSFVKSTPRGVNKSSLKTCRIFIKTTSSEAESVPIKRACVTASAMFSAATGAVECFASEKERSIRNADKSIDVKFRKYIHNTKPN